MNYRPNIFQLQKIDEKIKNCRPNSPENELSVFQDQFTLTKIKRRGKKKVARGEGEVKKDKKEGERKK